MRDLQLRITCEERMTLNRDKWLLTLAIVTFFAGALLVSTPAGAQNFQVDLSSTSNLCGGQQCFNVAGIFSTGTQFIGTTGMDNGHNGCNTPPYSTCPDAYSSNQIGLSSTTPPTLTPASLNVPFNFGTVNTTNCGPSTSVNCTVNVVNFTNSGVKITLPAANQIVYSTMIILGTAVNGSHSGKITATYTDNTTTVFTQTLSDWCGFGGNSNESIAVGGISRINSDGTLNGARCNLYAYTYTLDFTKTLESITLTDNDSSGASFALAITLKPPSYTITGSVANPTSVAPGDSSTATVEIDPQPGYTGTVNLSCAISPEIIGQPTSAATAPTCSLSPTSVTVTAGETSPPTTSLTFTAAKPSRSSAQFGNKLVYAFLVIPGIAITGLGLGSGTSRRKRVFGLMLLAALTALLLLTPGCVSYKHLGNVGTPPGQYTVSITGVDGNGLTQASNATGTSNTVVVTVTE